MEIYRISNLNFTYPLREKPALKKIKLTVEQGEFITICGKSGSGKSTLLRHLKTVLTPHGTREGEILFLGRPLDESNLRTQVASIGFVLQNPDNQIVTDKVWHELAFGLESLGMDSKTIRLRVAEMASFFGIQDWFGKNVAELSGGQKQLLNLASIMAMHPSVLILDEPTGQLDPIAAADFLGTVQKINRELGTTIIMTEHRLEEVLPMSNRMVVMDEGEIIVDDTPRKGGERLKEMEHDIFLAMPSPLQIYAGVESSLPCPITVQEGRRWLGALLNNNNSRRPSPLSVARQDPDFSPSPVSFPRPGKGIQTGLPSGHGMPPEMPPVIQLQEVWFKYGRELPDVIKDLSMEIYAGQFFAIVGGNGTGKTTALSIIRGLLRPYRGRVNVLGKDIFKTEAAKVRRRVVDRNARLPRKARPNATATETNGIVMLPQNPQLLFVKKTVELDLYEILEGRGLSEKEKKLKLQDVCKLAELEGLMEKHPYDLSGGEQQRAALAKVLMMEPQILLLDEPTKGLDGHFKIKLAGILKKLAARGVAVVMVSHDIEFCARYADLCALFFDGGIITQNTPRAFFSGNSFYTTAANRMARHFFPAAVTVEDVIEACRSNL
ncbi:MAG: ABC transporter ATP-binding protein [Dethiobacteria bacterium]|jgi:energy-coupling factor transporter ATP-binding protein EcfA2